MRSGGELFGNTIVGRFCSIGSNVIIGLERNKHPTNWLSTSFLLEVLKINMSPVCWIIQPLLVMIVGLVAMW